MFAVPSVYRNDILPTSGWLDLQTSEVTIYNVVFAPMFHAGTVIAINWKYDGPGRISGDVVKESFVQMTPDQRAWWSLVNKIVIVMAFVDLVVIGCGIFTRWRWRRRLFEEIPQRSAKEQDAIERATVLWSYLDVFDVVLRLLNIGFNIWHLEMYPDPVLMGDDGAKATPIMVVISDILRVDWFAQKPVQDKVEDFMALVVNLHEMLAAEMAHRMYAKALILLFFIRCVIYMNVHPRIAILYCTVVDMWSDFLHFLMFFTVLYSVLAYLGTWSFGDKLPDFKDFQTAYYTQFRMMVGEFNFPVGLESGFSLAFGVYSILFFLMVFSLLLNFFLAIVVDSYARVKERVSDCAVERGFLTDLFATLTYPCLGAWHGWPGRTAILMALLRADIDGDGLNDEGEEAGLIRVRVEDLVDWQILKSARQAESFMHHYNSICPAVMVSDDEQVFILQHRKLLSQYKVIDRIKSARGGEAVLPTAKEERPPKAPLAPPASSGAEELSRRLEEADAARREAEADRTEARRALHEALEILEEANASAAANGGGGGGGGPPAYAWPESRQQLAQLRDIESFLSGVAGSPSWMSQETPASQ